MSVEIDKNGTEGSRAGFVAAILGEPVRIAGLALAVSAATILAALGFEHLGDYEPCALCLKERIPYYVGIPLAILALAAASRTPPIRATGVLFALFTVVMGYGAALGIYHAGAEWTLWPGPSTCGAAGSGPADTMQMLEALKTPTIGPSCTDAVWRFAGLSFAGWNTVIAGGLCVLGLIGIARTFPAPDQGVQP